MFPEYARIKGKNYKLNTDFKVALKCFEIVEDENISDQERSLAVIYLIFGFIPDKDYDLFLKKAIYFLQCGEERDEQLKKEKDMDFIQDKKYIFSSFMSDYHIDLSRTKMHFWQFIYLLQGLTENSSLNRIREIRTFDLNTIKDSKQRAKIIEAKKQVELKITKNNHKKSLEEERLDKLFEKQLKGG